MSAICKPSELFQHPVELGFTPGLGAAAALPVGGIAIENFRYVPNASIVGQHGAAAQQGKGRLPKIRAADHVQGFAIRREGPCPRGAIVVSSFSARVFVT